MSLSGSHLGGISRLVVCNLTFDNKGVVSHLGGISRLVVCNLTIDNKGVVSD